jgi:transcriptional regulator with XRE-family HTH domain
MTEVKVSAMAAFAAQLKAWRKKNGWSQAALADKIGYSDSLVSGVETLDKTPTLPFSRACDEALGAPGTFEALHQLVSREAWPSYFAPVIDFEAEAVRIHEWELRVIPGQLQTENYARAVISAGQPWLDDGALERKVQGRLERQRIFERDSPPKLWTVLHECVLRQLIGGPAVMGEQLDRLLEVGRSSDVILQVLPFAAWDHPGTDGPLTVFDFADSTSKAYTECKGGGMITETPDAVVDLMATMNLIRAAALPPRDSMDLLRRIRSEIDDG